MQTFFKKLFSNILLSIYFIHCQFLNKNCFLVVVFKLKSFGLYELEFKNLVGRKLIVSGISATYSYKILTKKHFQEYTYSYDLIISRIFPHGPW